MSIGHKKPSYYLTYYDRLHFLIKIFHMDPNDKWFESDIKNKFRGAFTTTRRRYLNWWNK
jgi:hypothetical protein